MFVEGENKCQWDTSVLASVKVKEIKLISEDSTFILKCIRGQCLLKGHTQDTHPDFLAKPQISTKPKATLSSVYPDKSYRLTECDFNEAFCPVLCLRYHTFSEKVITMKF